ncbi:MULTISPECIES: hypothetical protein [unclassified Bradyrhizobium]|uniref:hypothetical protein n=1 Tax=unclassified Bradyrhizobium TaxID=2631580 RepID=UPI0027D736F4|nr:hypothetical protein TM233_42150 [Bradyrhizobium sp. TM233]GMO97996.1 hypothetical protein TM239_17100 [Bradyrhizobium sp. TM239]
MSIFSKILGAEPNRKSRLRDEQGELLPLSDLPLIPVRLKERLARLFDVYPEKPWWPEQAKRKIADILRPNWMVVEFGSGMSTLWLAPRVRRVVTVEANNDWASKISNQLQARGLNNVEMEIFSVASYNPNDLELDEAPDFVIVDAERRRDCIVWAFRYLKPGGYLYLDNADRPGNDSGSDAYQARSELLRLASERNAQVEFFRGIPPGLLNPAQGALVRIPS